MLRRGFQPRRTIPEEEGRRELVLPRRKCTAIYGSDPTKGVVVKQQGPKLVRDRLLDLMSDSQYHSAHELEALLPHGEWVRAMKELLALRFAFDRVSNSFKLRHRLLTERKQVLVELLVGIDATRPEGLAKVSDEVECKPTFKKAFQLPSEEPFDVAGDEDELPDERIRMVLSQDKGELVLSALDSSTMTAAILARKGSGKTYLGMVIAEEFMACSALLMPVVIIDPTGVWYGLRVMADGKPSSFGMLIMGGSKGDLPITCKQGVQAADILVALRPRSMLLDLSDMVPSEQHEFVADFAQRLFSLPVKMPMHLIIDEADEFAPQYLTTSRHQKRSLEALDRIVRRGRTRGIGTTLITQRTAVIAKNVLSQADTLFLLNMALPADLAAVDAWMRNGVPSEQRLECLGQLTNLSRGTAYFMQTGTSPKFRRFKVRERRTFDSSYTMKPDLDPSCDLRSKTEPIEPVLSVVSTDVLDVARKILDAHQDQKPQSDGNSGS